VSRSRRHTGRVALAFGQREASPWGTKAGAERELSVCNRDERNRERARHT